MSGYVVQVSIITIVAIVYTCDVSCDNIITSYMRIHDCNADGTGQSVIWCHPSWSFSIQPVIEASTGLFLECSLYSHRLQPLDVKSTLWAQMTFQDDIVTGTLTVRENIMFSANLRLPESMTTKDKEKRVEDTIYELGLEKCAETKVHHEDLVQRQKWYLMILYIIFPDWDRIHSRCFWRREEENYHWDGIGD